jgi:hypothetical protein
LSLQPVPGTGPAEAGHGTGRSAVPYLALLPMGFSVPPCLRSARCALTAPFHPCRPPLRAGGGFFSVALSVKRPSSLPPACIPPKRARVTRHRARWSSDFPPPACAGSDPPPFQNHEQCTPILDAWQARLKGRPSVLTSCSNERAGLVFVDINIQGSNHESLIFLPYDHESCFLTFPRVLATSVASRHPEP